MGESTLDKNCDINIFTKIKNIFDSIMNKWDTHLTRKYEVKNNNISRVISLVSVVLFFALFLYSCSITVPEKHLELLECIRVVFFAVTVLQAIRAG